MANTFRVAIMGGGENLWLYGIEVADLSVDQIATLLEKPGTKLADMGVQTVAKYEVMGGGRFYPSVSREEITEVMKQGVNVFIAMMPTDYYAFNSHDFYECLFSENLLDDCKTVVARVTASKNTTRRRGQTKTTPEIVMKQYGLDTQKLKGKLYVIADDTGKKAKSKKKAKEGTVKERVATLRSELLGEERKLAVVKPVKETITAGKALLGLGQRLSSWVGGLVKAH